MLKIFVWLSRILGHFIVQKYSIDSWKHYVKGFYKCTYKELEKIVVPKYYKRYFSYLYIKMYKKSRIWTTPLNGVPCKELQLGYDPIVIYFRIFIFIFRYIFSCICMGRFWFNLCKEWVEENRCRVLTSLFFLSKKMEVLR